ncbi:MAG: MutS N-terminal domain-containing protein, partial [Ktedonobacterales bacterium]
MTTPARRQYLDIKAQHQDAILLYQIGDFFETFDDDARIAARELQIALTGRLYGPGEHVPLAGVPIHALDTYAAKLVARGYKVAICEQTSPPGRGLVRREVTRILTPGTIVDPSMVPATRDNYLVAVALDRRTSGRKSASRGDISSELRAGLAYVDASTGSFACVQWAPGDLPDALTAELQRLMPAEVLLADAASVQSGTPPLASIFDRFTVTSCPSHYFDAESAHIRLCRHFGVPTLTAFGCEGLPLATAAAGAILTYLERMNPALLRLLTGLRRYDTSSFVEVDGRTWRALEVLEPSRSEAGATRNRLHAPTLLATLDTTRTAMGARLLRRQLLQPLKDRLALEERLDAVAELHEHASLREHIAAVLDGLGDLERLTARAVHGTAVPRELYALAHGLERVPHIASLLRAAHAPALQQLLTSLDPCPEVHNLIERGVADPALAEGRIIRAGFHEELDALVSSIQQARAW